MTLDPDFGWHLQFGRLIVKTHTIPINDIYSYTMPSYHFVDHEWGTDVIIASIYDRWGMWPLIILFGLINVSTLYFLIEEGELRWAAVPLFLAGGTLFDFTGVRPQVITWALLGLLISVLWHKKQWLKWRFFIPALFLVWANLHGGFAIGLMIMGWFVVTEAIENRRIDKKDSFVLVISILATLCNPYGYHLWAEIAKSALDPNLRWAIQEWYPAFYFTNLAFWLYVVISFFLVIRYRKKFSFKVLGIYALLFIAAMSSMRNIPIFVVISFYPTLLAVSYFYKEAGTFLYGKERFVRGYIGFAIVCLGLFVPQLGMFVYGSLSYRAGQNSYPEHAVGYLKNHLPSGNLFSSYDWGGYLIWKLPEKKVFIDGRMPSWRNASAPSNESTYALGDYKNLMENKMSFSQVAKKYDIDMALVPTSDTKKQHLIIFGTDLDNSWLFKPFFTQTWSFYPVVIQMKQMGWRQVYHDSTATIFEKPK
jgi:hypothetical protein